MVLAPLWVKLVQLSTDLRFFKRAEPDRVVVSATLAVLLLVWAALPLLERRTRAMLAVAVSLILTSIGTADLIHMRFFGTVIGMSELGAATGLPGITSSIMALVQWRDARYYIDCLAAVAGCIAYVRLCRHTDPLVRSDRRALSVGLLIVSVAAIVPTVRLVAADSEVFWDTWANREMVGRVGLLPFHMYDAVSHAAGRISEPKVGEAERREVAGQLAAWKSAQRGRSPLFGAAHGRNVILINAESLFAFPIGLRIDGQPVMPHFEELMGESLSFPNYFDEAYLGQSSDAELLALESLYPLRDSAYALRYPTRTPYGLPAILVGQRYSTLSATGTSAEIWDMNLRHPRERFERSYFDPAFPGTEHFNGAVADRQFFEQMAAHLESQPQPFMAFLMSASTHVPYDVPAAHRSMRVGHLEGTFVGRYLQAVNYFDSALGEFVDTLRSTGLLDESVFVIYGDHRAYLDDLKPVATLLNIDPDDVVRMWRARSTLPAAHPPSAWGTRRSAHGLRRPPGYRADDPEPARHRGTSRRDARARPHERLGRFRRVSRWELYGRPQSVPGAWRHEQWPGSLLRDGRRHAHQLRHHRIAAPRRARAPSGLRSHRARRSHSQSDWNSTVVSRPTLVRAAALCACLAGACAAKMLGAIPVAAQAAFIKASPNPVRPGRLGPGSTMITWQTADGAQGRVSVSDNGGAEALFASGASGSQPADWITTGSVYEFRLYREGTDRQLVASVVVSRRDDAFAAFEVSTIACALLLLIVFIGAGRLRGAWLLEMMPLAVMLGVTWTKLTYVTDALRPVWRFVPPERRTLSATLAILLLIWAALVLVRRRRRIFAMTLVCATLATIVVADRVHARFFDDVASVSEISAAPQMEWVPSSVRALVAPADALSFADVALLILFVPVYLRLSKRVQPLGPEARRVVAGTLAASCIVLAVPGWRLIRQPSFDNFFSRRGIVAEIGILPFHAYDIVQAIRTSFAQRVGVSDADRAEAQTLVAQLRSDGAAHSPLFGAARGRNLILVSAESLSAFPIGLVVDGQPVMPHLEALAHESLQFAHFYDEAHLGTTSDGELLALESLYPLADGPVATRFATNDFLGMPTILARHSYATVSAIGATAETWNVGQMHPRHGFAHSFFDRDFTPGERLNDWIADRVFFPQMLSRLESQPRPFMAFLLSASSHFPYELPAQLRTLQVGRLEGTMLGRYLQAAHYFDGAIGEFVEGLRRDGLLDQSVLAIYADHHGYLDDPEAIARLLGLPPDDILASWKTRRLIPFLVRLPDAKAAGVRDVVGGHLDIAPTLLALLGIDASHTAMMGRDLTQGVDQLVAFRDGGFVDGHGYYVNQPGAAPLCYDVAAGPADCAGFEAQRREALERLRVSDLIIRGNLVSRVAKPGPQ